jgi:chromosome segregation ATPase
MSTETPMTPAADVPTARESDQKLFATCRAIRADQTAAERDLAAKKAAYDELVQAPNAAEDLEVHVSRVTDAEVAIATAERTLIAIRHRGRLLHDQLHDARLRAIADQTNQIRTEQRSVDEATATLRAKRADHARAIRELDTAINKQHDRHAALERHATEIQPRTKHLQVVMRGADPMRPPAGVMVRHTDWQRFIEAARAAGLNQVDAIVDEATGSVRSSAVPIE